MKRRGYPRAEGWGSNEMVQKRARAASRSSGQRSVVSWRAEGRNRTADGALLTNPHKHPSIRLFAAATPVAIAANAVLFRKGDAGDGCFLIEHGLLKVSLI